MAAVVAVVAAMPVAAQAGPATTGSALRIYSFDGTGDGVLLVSGTIDPGAGRGLFASVVGEAAKTGAAPEHVFFPFVIDLDASAPHTYGALGRRDLCVDPMTVCRALPGGGLGFSTAFVVQGSDDHAQHIRYAIVARGAKVTIKEKMIGWRGRNLRGVHQVTDDEASGAGASAFGSAVGATLEASAPAAPGGSIAIAAPPCDAAGAGVTALTGPGASESGLCPTEAFGGVSTRAGTWSLTGAAAGVSQLSTRLLVLDL